MSPDCRKYVDRIASESVERPVVFVVDGDISFREALELVILSAGYDSRTAASAEEFLAHPRTIAPSCLLSELHFSGLTGLDLQRLVAERAELPIIFMSHQVGVQVAVQAVKNGAFGVFTKPLAHEFLLGEIRSALECSRAALRHLARIQWIRDRYDSLSAREREVMSLVVAGRLNKQIGSELGISEGTVKAHRHALMRKMQARSLAELISSTVELRVKAVRSLDDGRGSKYIAGVA